MMLDFKRRRYLPTVTSTEWQQVWGWEGLVDEVKRHGPYVITDHGRSQMVAISSDDYESLTDMEGATE